LRALPRFPGLPIPLLLSSRSSDEFLPPPPTAAERRALALAEDSIAASARRLRRPAAEIAAGRLGSAAALRALDAAEGGGFYAVSEQAARDPDAADAALGGDELVIDVQTHYVASARAEQPAARAILDFIRSVAPQRWSDLRGAAALSLAEYLRCVFVESETALAVLTSAPGEGERNILTNAEIAVTRELIDRLGGAGRLLHHAIVHPNLRGELDAMPELRERLRPDGWKIYTLYGENTAGRGFRLDDPRTGLPFLERSRALGVRVICAHKGFSSLARTGSPEDVGPAAAAFPDLQLLVYHSGYEAPQSESEEEGPFHQGARPRGTDRLVASLSAARVPPGANVWAELGSTWQCLVRRPREAAHVLGKLLLAVGEDRVLWGTDSIWYGSPQPLIDAFRAFRIPEPLRERHGYPELTPAVKRKILGENAARVYGIDLARLRQRAADDDLAWVRAALADQRGVAARL
jgi:predicted TIM-barrel fold metal-dependent hydrolase